MARRKSWKEIRSANNPFILYIGTTTELSICRYSGLFVRHVVVVAHLSRRKSPGRHMANFAFFHSNNRKTPLFDTTTRAVIFPDGAFPSWRATGTRLLLLCWGEKCNLKDTQYNLSPYKHVSSDGTVILSTTTSTKPQSQTTWYMFSTSLRQ